MDGVLWMSKSSADLLRGKAIGAPRALEIESGKYWFLVLVREMHMFCYLRFVKSPYLGIIRFPLRATL